MRCTLLQTFHWRESGSTDDSKPRLYHEDDAGAPLGLSGSDVIWNHMDRTIRVALTGGDEATLGRVAAADVARLFLGYERALARAARCLASCRMPDLLPKDTPLLHGPL